MRTPRRALWLAVLLLVVHPASTGVRLAAQEAATTDTAPTVPEIAPPAFRVPEVDQEEIQRGGALHPDSAPERQVAQDRASSRAADLLGGG
jgi:hypothetical protein